MNRFSIFILTHGELCHEYVKFFRYITGIHNDIIIPIALLEKMTPQEYHKILSERLGKGYPIFLTDIAGGTCDNIARLVVNQIGKGKVISGVNIPMIMELIKIDSYKTPEELTEKLIGSGKNGIQEFLL